ncbi:MAG: type II toxin-antitoxin system Phd/YefM family antitoxin [Bacillota bacterium]|nr:type II toxin-antitoxin system Phd/YefM family antitoxin [Bacillota bacterium]
MPLIIPIRDLKDTAKVSELCKQSSEPIYITKNGYGDMVLMSMKVYEEKMLLLEAYQKIAEAEAEIQAGRTMDAKAALQVLAANAK